MWTASTVVWFAGRVDGDPAMIDEDLVPHVVAEAIEVSTYTSPMTTREGTPAARHMAAVRTECSVQSPLRLWATSLAAANAVSKFLSVTFWCDPPVDRRGLLPGVDQSRG